MSYILFITDWLPCQGKKAWRNSCSKRTIWWRSSGVEVVLGAAGRGEGENIITSKTHYVTVDKTIKKQFNLML